MMLVELTAAILAAACSAVAYVFHKMVPDPYMVNSEEFFCRAMLTFDPKWLTWQITSDFISVLKLSEGFHVHVMIFQLNWQSNSRACM